MKKIHLSYLCFFVVVSASAQQKGDNTIHVKVVDFRKVVTAVLDAGYVIEKIDSNYQTLTTEPKNYKPGKGGLIRLAIRVKDSTAIITSDMGLRAEDFVTKKEPSIFEKGNYGFYYGQVICVKSKSNLFYDAFEAMDKFAKTLGTPTYLKL
jgi:hypothetical protein